MRVIVTGSRKWGSPPERAAMVRRLTALFTAHPVGVTLVHGACRGADLEAVAVAWNVVRSATRSASFLNDPHPVDPADWRRPDGTIDRSAGPRRNAEMVALGADLCLAFVRGRFDESGKSGTADCVRRARAAGIPVEVIEVGR